jgi:Encapsulating protein for peroxidase
MVPVRNAQMADPEMSSALALFRRAANVAARLEDAVVFRGLAPDPLNPGGFAPPGGLLGLPRIWQITGALATEGLWSRTTPRRWVRILAQPGVRPAGQLVAAVSGAIGLLEQSGHFGPFAVVLGQGLFLLAQTPDPGSLVFPQDRMIPFLGGGPLLRSSTLDQFSTNSGLVMALGGAPIELVVATDVCLQFIQLSLDPVFFFRVAEKIALRIRESEAIIQLRP